MNSKKIKFAQEFCFNAILEDAENVINAGLLDYQAPQDDLFIKKAQGEFARVRIDAEEAYVLSELHNSYGRALLRADKISGEYLSLTLLKFSDSEFYDEENPLRIVVDQAVSADLRGNNIEPEKAVNEIRRQMIVDGKEKYAFAYSRGNDSEQLELIGDRYTFTITETPQKYLHIIRIRKRSNRDRIDSPIVLLRGSIEVVNELTDRAILTKRADEQYSRLISSDAEFINLWNIYNDLELESVKQQASEMGFLKYKGFRYANGMIVFSLSNGYTRREFCMDNMYYVAIGNIDEDNPMEYNFRSATIIGTEIDYACVNTTEFRIKEDMDTTRSIPVKGYLLPSVSGSAVQNKRRKRAQSNILSNKCPLTGLKNIIQGGAQVGAIGRKNQPVSSNLEKEIFGDKNLHFTEKQKIAMDAAINTPDIAIIQGPPGTGKTTIIKAIVKRIDELWDSKAKILITSTQHDAVDNAVEEINYGGVPVNRVSVRKGKDEENFLIYDWIDRMIESCEDWIYEKGVNTRSTVREIFEKLVRIEASKDISEIHTLLTRCFEQVQNLDLSPELFSKFSMVLAEVGAKASISKGEDKCLLLDLLQSQRLNKEAFLDDGITQLKQLQQFLKFDSDLDYEIPAYWKKLLRITKDCAELDDYLQLLRGDCEHLEAMCPNSGDVNDDLLEKDIHDLIKAIRFEIIALGDDTKTLLTNLIWEFKQELTNSSNVDQLIRAYSKINAATCQQAANPNLSASMAGFEEEYDFVIVDEAARSNPLDLLIPMSMGRKIILVGDHKQLPHMVERDVVRAVARKSEGRDVESVLEESLFMRLNAAVAKEDKKLGITRTAMLSEQYRMHPDICDLVNIFYDGKLETLCKREDKEHNLGLYDKKAVAWIDMPLCDEYPAEIKRQSVSRQCEVDMIQRELAKILANNDEYRIGIITFYSAQAKLLNDMVRENFPGDVHRIQAGTVDAFQGKEFDVVLLSVVRSNQEKELRRRVGFLNNDNRLCVAFSRAKRLLVAVGDARTVAFDGETEYVKALHEMYKKCQLGV